MNQIKSLLLSHHHSTSALVSEIIKMRYYDYVYIYIYINTHTFSVYFENIYMYIHLYYIIIFDIIYKYS